MSSGNEALLDELLGDVSPSEHLSLSAAQRGAFRHRPPTLGSSSSSSKGKELQSNNTLEPSIKTMTSKLGPRATTFVAR